MAEGKDAQGVAGGIEGLQSFHNLSSFLQKITSRGLINQGVLNPELSYCPSSLLASCGGKAESPLSF